MRPLSATEAIEPAIARTRQLMFSNFRLGRWFKLSLIAIFAAGASSGSFFNRGFGNTGGHGPHSSAPFPMQMPHVALAAIMAVGVILVAIGLVLYYISCRLKFVLLEMVATRDPYVGRKWSKYGEQTLRLFGLTILISLAFLALILPIIVPFIRTLQHMEGVSAGRMFAAMIPVFTGIFFLSLVAGIVSFIVRQFMVPPMAFENASIPFSWERARIMLEQNFGQFILLLVLRILLGLALTVVAAIAFALVLVVTAIPVGILGYAGYATLHHAGTGGLVTLVTLGFILGFVVVLWLFAVWICLSGTVAMFLECYGIYYVGSRYAPLGNLLWPPQPQNPVQATPTLPDTPPDDLAPQAVW